MGNQRGFPFFIVPLHGISLSSKKKKQQHENRITQTIG